MSERESPPRPYVVAVRAALPSPRPQAWQATQMAVALAANGHRTTLLGDAGRPEGTPETVPEWVSMPELLRLDIPARPSRPPLAGLRFRRHLRGLRDAERVLLCRDARVAAAQPAGAFAAVVMEWHTRPDPADRAALSRPDLHVTVAEGLAEDLRRAGVSEERVLLLPNACGLSRSRTPAADGPVLALGLHRRDGLDLALDAWEAHPDLPPLLLAGLDQGRVRTRRWQERIAGSPTLSARVELVGAAWGEAREALLDRASAWLAVYPEDEDTRSRLCPLQVVDALGSGLPLIAPDLPSIRALGAPFCPFAPGDAAALAAAVRVAQTQPPRPALPRPSWRDRARALATRVERDIPPR